MRRPALRGSTSNVAVRTSAQIDIHLNDLLGGGIGVANQGTGVVNATQNYWGCPGGPGTPGCSTVSGNVIVASSLPRPLHAEERGEDRFSDDRDRH